MINGSYGSGGTWTGTKKPTVRDGLTKESRQAQTDNPRQDPRVLAGTHYVGFGNKILPRSGGAKKPTTTIYKPPSGGKGVGTTGVTGGSVSTATTPTWSTPTTQATQASSTPSVQASTPTTDYWKAAVTKEGRKATTADPRQDPRVLGGTHYVGFNNAILPYGRSVQSKDVGGTGIVTGNTQYDALTPKEKYDMGRRNRQLGGLERINQNFTEHNAQKAARQLEQAEAKRRYDALMEGNWSPERQAGVDALYGAGGSKITYDEYQEGAHDAVPDGQGGYQQQGNTTYGYRPDGTSGWYDKRDYPGWTREMGQEMFAPRRDDLNAASDLGFDVKHMGRDQAAEIASNPAQYRVPRPAEWDQPQQQSMAQQYGWGAGLGGQPQQQQMPQWGQPQQQMQMPQWGQPPQSSQQQQWAMQPWGGQQQQQAMPQWGGAPQQQAMPQWGQMMQQQPMGGPMAGMEAARMGGGAMQQMGGGSPWASMWGDPFAGRQMTTDPNSPAMGGLPQMDPTQQLMMQMMGGGGGLSGGFGEGGGSSGGGGMSGAGQAASGGDPYGSLASILALFAGGGGGGGGGAGASYNPMYGGLPRNGLYYADLMGAGG